MNLKAESYSFSHSLFFFSVTSSVLCFKSINLIFYDGNMLQNITMRASEVPPDTINSLIIMLEGDIFCDYS
ncbi:hypothetical protein EVG73_28730 [Salmonella enterica subsp. enterica serovar Newport]|uniref:Uncharacterized protein n=1 Tax=Salmonella newport TaxID=108619 RepID=A0A5X8Y1V0_SALNE|nr:hypothetical protein [Salmonella enterica subsp. enterica serovar Newport]